MEELQQIMKMEELEFNFTGTGPQRAYAHDILNKALWGYLYIINNTESMLAKEQDENRIKRMQKTIEVNREKANEIHKLTEKKRISSKKVIEASEKAETFIGGWPIFKVDMKKI